VDLPAQPAGVAWPTVEWPVADPADLGADHDRLRALLDVLVSDDPHPVMGQTFAAAVVCRGHLVAERYGLRPVRDLRALEPDPPLERLDETSELLSWSMAKSLTHLAVGVAVGDGVLDVGDPVPEPLWAGEGDRRAAITWDHLLTMRPGLAWREEYVVDAANMPDVVEMLFGSGASDMGAFAAGFPMVHEPGSPEAFCYSSGTTNIVTRNLQRALGLDRDGFDRWIHERILDPAGMAGCRLEYDAAGTFIGSSYAHATLRDWCRFGLLAMRDGTWDDRRIVPEGWIDHGRTPRSLSEGVYHGAHWWAWDQEQMPFGAHGFEGQRVICFPARDVVVVRLGKVSEQDDATTVLNNHLTEIANCFPRT
jgi:CubicO group peptidase (beta-lactamase class C family)